MNESMETQKDFLTGFYTRDYLGSALLERIVHAKLHKEKFSIILKSGDVILGSVIDENKSRLIVKISLDQGSCLLHIEKPLIESITRIEKQSK